MSREVVTALTSPDRIWVTDGARLSGAVAHAWVTVDPLEHERRAKAGLGAVTDLALLDLFLTLPRELPVPSALLCTEEQDQLRRAPQGCWTGTPNGDIVRLLQRPCTVELVVVDSDRWSTGLGTARRFAAAAPVVVRIPSSVRVDSSMLWGAQLLGIGVWQAEGADHRVLVDPDAPPNAVVKAAMWRFEEGAYRGLLTDARGSHSAQRGPGTAPDPTAAGSSAPGRSR